MNRKTYSSPLCQLIEMVPEDILTISSGEKLNFDSNDGSGFGVFRWLEI